MEPPHGATHQPSSEERITQKESRPSLREKQRRKAAVRKIQAKKEFLSVCHISKLSSLPTLFVCCVV